MMIDNLGFFREKDAGNGLPVPDVAQVEAALGIQVPFRTARKIVDDDYFMTGIYVSIGHM